MDKSQLLVERVNNPMGFANAALHIGLQGLIEVVVGGEFFCEDDGSSRGWRWPKLVECRAEEGRNVRKAATR